MIQAHSDEVKSVYADMCVLECPEYPYVLPPGGGPWNSPPTAEPHLTSCALLHSAGGVLYSHSSAWRH
jgi:hypothetical protein